MQNILPHFNQVSTWLNHTGSLIRNVLTKVLGNTLGLTKQQAYWGVTIVDIALIIFIIMINFQTAQSLVSPLISPHQQLQPLTENKNAQQVFGFAPHWTINKLDNVDFETLTTFAYFGVPLQGDGTLDKEDVGYQVFKGKKATTLFKKAHAHGTRVVLTVTQMDNAPIRALLDDEQAQQIAISQIVEEVENRGIDGVNVDLEYTGNPGEAYRNKFTKFVDNLSREMHAKNPHAQVTVSVYASAIKEPKIYNIKELAAVSDGIFMMAYDFAVAGSDNAIPTSPLYGHKAGKYWYDVSTAVDDFLTVMPADKLILGLPWYGYNYMVYEPEVKAETRPYSWRGKSRAQTYALVQEDIKPDMPGILAYRAGWDDHGQVGWKAYYVAETDTWRMIFLDDTQSLAIKYDYAKDKNLGGVGMWALGFDAGTTEMWTLLQEKFGKKLADASKVRRINEDETN